MKVVLAPDSFKGTLAAADVATALRDGWLAVRPRDEIELRPMADGGEGTLDAVAGALPLAEWMPITVAGPVGEPIEAYWLLLPPDDDSPGGTGVVELASTCGIEILRGHLEAWNSSTAGFGQAVNAALEHGVTKLLLGIGSSASTDGGVGFLYALGARFETESGSLIPPGAAGLKDLARVDFSGLRPVPDAGVTVLTDVTTPLLGKAGTAAVFGPQKGLRPDEIEPVDALLRHLASFLDVDVSATGAGAAGGIGAALLQWGATLTPGASEIAGLTELEKDLARADLVVTGEGAFDGQSAVGKVPALVSQLAAEARTPVMLVAGTVLDDADTSAFTGVVSLTELAGSQEAAMRDPKKHLIRAGKNLAETVADEEPASQ